MRRLVLLLALTSAMQLSAETTARYMVALKPSPGGSKLQIVSNAAESAAHNVRRFETVNFIGADLTPTEAEALKRSGQVAYLSPVVPRFATGTPVPMIPRRTNSSPYSHQTIPPGIDAIHSRQVWPFTRGHGNVNVAIVDTGIDYRHDELKDRYAGGYNVLTKTANALDDYFHGTHVAGVVAADDNGIGVVGVAPLARLWAVKVLDSHGSGTDETVSAGIDWVLARKRELGGNWIVNLSIGSASASITESQMFAQAISEGLLIVAAAGNSSSTYIDYPAAYPGVLAVSAIDNSGELADFSTYGSGIAFAAPGVNVLSTVPVGSANVASIDGNRLAISSALPVAGSAIGEVTAETISCGLGRPEDIPTGVHGRIALIRRGDIYFRDKAKNAINAGAVGVIFIPPVDDPRRFDWTLFPESCGSSGCARDPLDVSFPWTIVLSTSEKDGEALIDHQGEALTMRFSLEDYATYSGTSMATPHVAGAAALVWSLAPNATARQIETALKMTADDLGPRGYDIKYGYGRVDPLAAAKYIVPALFGLPPTPPPPDGRRRSASSGH